MLPDALPHRRIVLVETPKLYRLMASRVYGDNFAPELLGGAVVLARVSPRCVFYVQNPKLAPPVQEKK